MANILIGCGVFWIIFALIQHTGNFRSAITYKVVPFFTGLATIVCAMDLYGLINIF